MRYIFYNIKINFGTHTMLENYLVSDILEQLNFNSLTTSTLKIVLATLEKQNIVVSEHEVDTAHGELSLNLSPPSLSAGCVISVSNNSVFINPDLNIGDDRADFTLFLNDDRTAQEWSLIVVAFAMDALRHHKNEFLFEVLDEDSNLIDDTFRAKSLCHALFKTQNLHTLRNVNYDSIQKVTINIDNEDGDSRELTFNIKDNFFALCDRNLNNDDIILALTYLQTKLPESTYSIRQNLKLGVEF